MLDIGLFGIILSNSVALYNYFLLELTHDNMTGVTCDRKCSLFQISPFMSGFILLICDLPNLPLSRHLFGLTYVKYIIFFMIIWESWFWKTLSILTSILFGILNVSCEFSLCLHYVKWLLLLITHGWIAFTHIVLNQCWLNIDDQLIILTFLTKTWFL